MENGTFGIHKSREAKGYVTTSREKPLCNALSECKRCECEA